MTWVLRILGYPVATLENESEECEDGITGGSTHAFERADNLTTTEFEGEPWTEYESDFGFRGTR